ncbi:toxin glutamine deamidase domain-containing protein [Micromonospora sp. SH-82]|uniref:toxin glutamine deamidase domain-containing protein n=1 Tax=Micromonospora sp. SH-82 TaxID=3132938 RepID=UPI003EB94A12
MTLLPSPIPHPLDLTPWDLPGWVYEALDWVVGVEWPEGDERAVWDLADQWYAVAGALTGPRADATAAAGEIRSGYGGTGAVAQAFDNAWRRVADGDEAPLPVLLAITQDLGRLVEECGCDIEGAKIEVWIELAILVTELAILATVTVLTAGAASPAAAPVIAATRVVVQQIFRRLVARLARKTLRPGLKEAGERAARETVRHAARGLGRKAALGGAVEAAEESGITLATQTYQNTTGRRQGLDVGELGTSALGGLAGGAAAPLASLGRHATGRLTRMGEHVGRSMGAEVIAENAAGLATGQGPTSLEEAARAAASGARGSTTAQADAALTARLDGRLSALAGGRYPPPGLVPPPPTADPARPDVADALPAAGPTPAAVTPPAAGPSPTAGPSPAAVTPPAAGPSAAASPVAAPGAAVSGVEASPVAGPGVAGPTVAVSPSSTVDMSVARTADSSGGAATGQDPTARAPVTGPEVAAQPSPVRGTDAAPTLAEPGTAAATAPPGPASGYPGVAPVAPDGSPSPATSTGPTNNPGPPPGPGPSPAISGPGPSAAAPGPGPSPATSGPGPSAAAPGPGPSPATSGPGPSAAAPGPGPVAGELRRVGLLDGTTPSSTAAPTPSTPSSTPVTSSSVPVASPSGSVVPPRTPPVPGVPSPRQPSPLPRPGAVADPLPPGRAGADRHAAWWTAERDAAQRRQYQGHLHSRRAWYEQGRRTAEAGRMREWADYYAHRARVYSAHASQLRQAGQVRAAIAWDEAATDEFRNSTYCRDQVDVALSGAAAPPTTTVDGEADFRRVNESGAQVAHGAVETDDRSALTGRAGHPPPIDRSRRYGQRGGLRPPLRVHQTDLERHMPRDSGGRVQRTADPRRGGWFRLANDGGPQADPTRGINCIDCTLSLYETWAHGRPRVSAPRTFDGYQFGDVRRPIDGEAGGSARIEAATGGRFQRLCAPPPPGAPVSRGAAVHGAYRRLHDHLRIGGHGSYAFVVTEWEGGGAHVWVALNQNGTVLYLDPQLGVVSERPPYGHRGVPHRDNVVDVDALVLGPDGRPMPLDGLQRGRYSVLPDPPPQPRRPGYAVHHPDRPDPPHRPGSANVAGPPTPDGDTADPRTPGVDRNAAAVVETVGSEISAREVVAAAVALDDLRTAGVSPARVAAELDPAALQRLVPHLGEQEARDASLVFADDRVRRMLDEAWRSPTETGRAMAGTLLTRLAGRPDLVRVILDSPELAVSLTARPVTLLNLSDNPRAIQALTEVLAGLDADIESSPSGEIGSANRPSLITAEQQAVSEAARLAQKRVTQPRFNPGMREDPEYMRSYITDLYRSAEVAQRQLNALAVEISKIDGRQVGKPGWRTAPKRLDRVRDKIAKFQGDASKLHDLAAAKVEFRSLNDVYLALERVMADPSIEIVRFEDRFLDPQKSGYCDLQFVLKMSNGHLGEFRIHLEQVDEVAAWEHSLYEVRRDIGALALQEGRLMTAREERLVDRIREFQKACFEKAVSSAIGSSDV